MRVVRFGAQRKLAAGDAGEIEQVADELGLSDVALHHGHLVANVVRQPHIFAQRSGAEQHGRERRAQLVGKRGDELVFGLRSGLGGFLGKAQPFLRGLALGDVADEADEEGALGAGERINAQLGGKLRSVAAQRRQLEPPPEDRAFARFLKVRQAARVGGAELLRNDALGQRLPDHFLAAPAEDAFGAGFHRPRCRRHPWAARRRAPYR